MIRRFVWFLITMVIVRFHSHEFSKRSVSDLHQSAFCRPSNSYKYHYYPTDPPERHLPWIWEAIYDPNINEVELTTMSRVPCMFDESIYEYLLSEFPSNKHQLGYGRRSNIIVPFDDKIEPEKEYYLINDYVLCEYIDMKNNTLNVINSNVIRGIFPFTSIGTLQIRCPVPADVSHFYGIRLILNDNRREYKTSIFSVVSVTVPVCTLPTYNVQHKKFNLTVCTASNRGNRSHLVEWIEYHRLVGVQHFYIYDTYVGYPPQEARLGHVLQDYIDDGIVSVIPWPFMNCFRYLGSGRANTFKRNRTISHFLSPKAISQQGALASCYSRFKHTSKYMIHIDDDEFLTFSSELMKDTLKSVSHIDNLVDLADTVFATYPLGTSIRFEPVTFYPCYAQSEIEHILHNAIKYPMEYMNQFENMNLSTMPTILPRIGVWNISLPEKRKYECKLLMRTDRVLMFFIHFESEVLLGPWRLKRRKNSSELTFPLTHLSMLHYKTPPVLVNNILEGQIPMTLNMWNKQCKQLQRKFKRTLLYDYHAKIPMILADKLKRNYGNRTNYRLADSGVRIE